MKRALCVLFFAIIGFQTISQPVILQYDSTVVRQVYAIRNLRDALVRNGHPIRKSGGRVITLVLDRSLGSEAFTISFNARNLVLKGGDNNGILYGCLSLIEDLDNKIPIAKIKSRSESPTLPFRAIKYDLPWDTYRHSTALSQHQETCSDIQYWTSFLDMMAANRFNILTLWNLHPYTFMIKPKNFPEASPWNDHQMDAWRKLFGSIFHLAKERGIETYIIPFNIFVTPEFAKAHHVALDNLDHHFFVRGDTSEIIKRYTRECVTQLLDEYPDLTGMGLTLGEGMAGMTPQQREDWMKETIIEGMRLADRKSKLIHRIPFSSTIGSLGPTSIETEQITRRGIEREAKLDFLEGPIWADLKFNWSHAHATTKLIKVHGGKLYGTYFTPAPTDYKITWTARNEDFFCLRWGVPEFVRAHINANTHEYVGGYMVGSETYIPAKDYFTKSGTKTPWKYAFERQWLFYKTWGRLLFNPDTPDATFVAEFVRRYGVDGTPLFEASVRAGKTPLRLASSFDFTWDFSLYSEGFMALDNSIKRVEYISVNRQIHQPTLDPDYVSVIDYVSDSLQGKSFDHKITPLLLATMLTSDCTKALDLIKNIHTENDIALTQEVGDVRAWANLGLFFAQKLQGAVALQTYRLRGGEENKQRAVISLERALHYWDAIIAITRPLYNDMPLTHLSEQDGKSWQENDHLRFHWEILRPDVERDIQIAKESVPAGE